MPAEFSIVSGTHKTLVPSATGVDGSQVSFPVGSVFLWQLDKPDAARLSDPNVASPDLLGEIPTDPNSPLVINMTVVENGFTHNISHTVDVVAADVDPIQNVDFTLN